MRADPCVEDLDPILADAGLTNAVHTPIRGSFFAMCEVVTSAPASTRDVA